ELENMTFFRKLLLPTLFAGAWLFAAGQGHADVLVGPGGVVLTPGETFPGVGSVIAIQTIGNSNSNANFSSTLSEAVFREHSGALDFLYQASNGSGSGTSIADFSVSSFGTGPARVGFATNNPAGLASTGNKGSTSASRSGSGTLMFSFGS